MENLIRDTDAFLNAIYMPDILRGIGIAICLYNCLITFLTKRTAIQRRDIEHQFLYRSIPDKVFMHLRRISRWGSVISLVLALDLYEHFGTGVRWNTLVYLFLAGYYFRAIYPLYKYELEMLTKRNVEIAEARAQIEISDAPDKAEVNL